MSAELIALLQKAVRRLSEEEQDEVLRELLDARVELVSMRAPTAVAGTSRLPPGLTGTLTGVAVRESPALREVLTAEGGGPWQTVPVRLPVELYERLKQWCQTNNFTMAVVMRGLVARFLDEHGSPRAESADEH